MKTIFVTGITGQDGSYLAELLLDKGFRVVGVVRDIIKAESALQPVLKGKIELVDWDMRSEDKLVELLQRYTPIEVYNFAAYSSGQGMYDDPIGVGEINGLAVSRILEAIRKVDVTIRFCQASSSEMFGNAAESPQSEKTQFLPRSPYGAAKIYAHNMISIYRQHYGLYACSAILFNHESPRRGTQFVTRKITQTVAKIKLGMEDKLELGNIHARRDWGFAGDFVRAMWMMLNQSKPADYVIATGKTHSVLEFCEIAFSHVGLNYKDYIVIDDSLYRETEQVELVGDPNKAKKEMGWSCLIDFRQLVHMMVDEDMRLLLQ